MDSIKFEAEVRQIKTMADRSTNLILNIPEYNKEQAKQLMDWLLDHVAVAIVKLDGSKSKPDSR